MKPTQSLQNQNLNGASTRYGNNYDADAVGGMLKYVAVAEYKIAFDPVIAEYRTL